MSQITKIHLDVIRHGETELLKQGGVLRGRLDDKLTAVGYEQMRHTFMGHYPTANWQLLASSDLSRCADFAQDRAQELGLACVILSDLQEIDFGSWEGQRTADLYEKFPDELGKYWQTPHLYTPPHAESVADFKSRIQRALIKIAKLCQDKNIERICVITHGGVIKMLYHLAGQVAIENLLTAPAELGELHRFFLVDGHLKASESPCV